MIAETGTPPIHTGPEGNADGNASEMSREDAQLGYNALKAARDFQGAQDFYAEHRQLLG